jgi:multidrug transporter EmrE-like cation transporter
MFPSTLIILLSVSISSLAHVFLKRGMIFHHLNNGIATDDLFILSLKFLSNYWILGGIFLHFCALIFWLWALSYVEISYAYPFLALGYVMVGAMAWLWLGEDISLAKIIGMAVIMIGILIISRSS